MGQDIPRAIVAYTTHLMNTLFATFSNNLLPILLISAAGFLLGKLLSIETRSLGRVLFYILSPVLVFNLLITASLPFDRIALMMGYAACIMLTVGALAFLFGKLFKLERSVLTAVVLTSIFANNGNYGMPLISFAFGKEALAYASIYFVTSSILTNTLGVLIVSLGHLDLKNALLGLLKVPAIYAILAALLVIRLGWSLPIPLERTVSLVASATIPVMIILLGLELARVQWSRHLKALGITTALRLLVGPFIGLLFAGLFHLPAPARQAGITEAGMPSAVLNTVLATEYKIEPSLVTAIVFASTLLSPLSLTPLLVFLGR
jgi:malate permease and related proteins